ncbi:hypothetical protein OG216_13060 [Streptomycetaceae bacterium NBC_01309]
MNEPEQTAGLDGRRLAAALDEEAERAGELGAVDGRHVAVASDRRHRRRTAAFAGAAATVAAALVAGIAVLAPGTSDPPATTVAESTPTPTPRPTGGEAALAADPQEPGYFTCGQPIRWNIVGPKSDGLTLTIESLSREPPGGRPTAPQWSPADWPLFVTYRLESERNVGMDPTDVYPMVLILRDGVVIGGPMAADEELRMRDMGKHVVPAVGAFLYGPNWRPWPVVEAKAANSWLCGLAKWDDLWANPERYSVAVVMTPLATVWRDYKGPNADFTRLDRPLMMAEIPLSRVQ